jgi:hypothetical protein
MSDALDFMMPDCGTRQKKKKQSLDTGDSFNGILNGINRNHGGYHSQPA